MQLTGEQTKFKAGNQFGGNTTSAIILHTCKKKFVAESHATFPCLQASHLDSLFATLGIKCLKCTMLAHHMLAFLK